MKKVERNKCQYYKQTFEQPLNIWDAKKGRTFKLSKRTKVGKEKKGEDNIQYVRKNYNT